MEQKRVDDTLRAMLRRTLQHVTGNEPTELELDNAVRREFARLSERLRRSGDFAPTPMADALREPDRPSVAAPNVTWLNSDQLREAEAAFVYAKAHGLRSIIDGLRAAAVHREPVRIAPRLPQCVDEFLCTKQAEARAAVTIAGYRSKLQRFADAFPARSPAELTPHEVAQFITRAKHQTTRRDWWETLSSFYKWCVGIGYACENPLPQALARPPRLAGAQLVLTPSEARQILVVTKDTDQIGFWVLALFAGLRTAEIRRLQAEPAPWSVVRLDSGVIDLPARVGKTGARIIPVLPVLKSWLVLVRDRDVPFFPKNHFVKCRRVRETAMAERCHPLAERYRVSQPGTKAPNWEFNVARRSYITYRLAMPGVTYADVAREAGNTEAVLRKNYQRRVTAVAARDFFSLTPGRV